MRLREWFEALLVAIIVIVFVPLAFITVCQFFQGVQ